MIADVDETLRTLIRRDALNGADVEVVFDAPTNSVLEVNPATGKEIPVEDDSPDMPGLQLSLDAGQGRLFLLPAASK